MQAKITYVYHSCFLVELNGRTLLFDYPAEVHLSRQARDLVQERISGADLYVFYSHSHEDHFEPKARHILDSARAVKFIVSDDVPDLYPGSVPRDALVVEPDEEYELGDMRIKTLMSNDLGVAFIIRLPGAGIYYGGDLADWAWETLDEKALAFTENFFREALERVKAESVDIAFSNVDKRLANLAGGPRFVREVKPRLFVPMHTFGNVHWLDDLVVQAGDAGSTIFIYKKTGDEMVFDLD